MSKRNTPKFKVYSKFGSKLTDHPKLTSSKLKSKKWQFVLSANRRPRKETEYGSILRAKQRLNAFYGGIKNRQLTTLFVKAGQYKGNQTINFIKLLERRLDVFLFRSKLSPSLHEIRQLIQHGHFLVNGSVVKTSSFTLKKNDRVSVKEKSIDLLKDKVKTYYSKIISSNNISKKMSLSQIIRQNLRHTPVSQMSSPQNAFSAKRKRKI